MKHQSFLQVQKYSLYRYITEVIFKKQFNLCEIPQHKTFTQMNILPLCQIVLSMFVDQDSVRVSYISLIIYKFVLLQPI